jgi:hypothetical protein
MSLTVTVTNLTDAPVSLDDMYMSLGESGSATESITIKRSAAQLDAMDALKALVSAGSVSVDITHDASDVDLLSGAIEMYGVISSLSVNSTGVVTSDVVFATPFANGVTPRVTASIVQGSVTTFQAGLYLRSVSNTGFTAALDVTTAVAGTVTAENPTMSPAENGTALGPFTATLANVPLTSAAITLHWLESTVAKTATITGTSTIGGSNAANLAAASINRTTGALSITFATAHAPDANSITVDYAQLKTCNINWIAKY